MQCFVNTFERVSDEALAICGYATLQPINAMQSVIAHAHGLIYRPLAAIQYQACLRINIQLHHTAQNAWLSSMTLNTARDTLHLA